VNALEAGVRAPEHAIAPGFGFADCAPDARTSLYAQVVRVIGNPAADKLITHFGGRRLYIPMVPARGKQIPRSIGMRAAIAMARAFGRERILIPATCDQERRRARIFAMRANGISVSRIARELGCTERYVYKVLALKRSCATGRSSTSAQIAERLKRGRLDPGR
jgi:Mor family transcriptional regulator